MNDDNNSTVPTEWENFFPDNIGQQEAVNHFNGIIHLEKYSLTPSYKKPIALLGEAGMGKTSLAEKLPATLTKATGKEWKYVTLTPTDSCSNFLRQYTSQVFRNQPTVIFIDEIADLDNKRIVQWWKRLLETNREVRDITAYLGDNEYVLPADPFNHIHICATNEELDDEALIGTSGRYKSIYIAPYTLGEIGQLLKMMAGKAGISFTDSALEYLSNRVKGSGRAVGTLVESLQYECKEKIDIDAARRTAARDKRFPGGLDQKDVVALQFLAKRKNISVGEVSATLREHEKTTKNRLRVLAGSLHCLSTGRGRFSLADEGRKYLEMIVNLQTAAAKMKVATARI